MKRDADLLPPVGADAATAQRRHWLAVLAQAPRAALARHAAPLLADHQFEWLRRPEIGLAMVRARVSNGGDRFNLGEATVTRCALRLQQAGSPATVGVGYVLGRDAERAEWVAAFDALLQVPALQPLLMQSAVEALARAAAEQRQREQQRIAASRVRFYTLQGEAAR